MPLLNGGNYLGWDEGVPTLDRLCCRRYASGGFPQEDFLVNTKKTKIMKSISVYY